MAGGPVYPQPAGLRELQYTGRQQSGRYREGCTQEGYTPASSRPRTTSSYWTRHGLVSDSDYVLIFDSSTTLPPLAESQITSI